MNKLCTVVSSVDALVCTTGMFVKIDDVMS